MADLNTIQRISRHLVRGECDAALGAIPLLSLRERSPQRLVLLRFMATACDDPAQLAAAARLAERLYPMVDDVEGLIGLAEILLRTGKNQKALAVLRQALDTAPTSDQALLLLARAQYETGQQARAAATLKKVSPLAPIYKDAVGLTGMILYDKLERLNEAYRSMLVAVDPKDPASWARLAEAAWATNRFTQAHQIARRVLEARTLAQSSPEVQLAMQFVLVATLCQARKFPDAERGVDALIALVPSVQSQLWSYAGGHAAVSRIRDTSLQPFLEALLDYAESLGRTGNPDQLRKLLHDARDAAR
jgi:tetratricopeptide (TPR) repeat protein